MGKRTVTVTWDSMAVSSSITKDVESWVSVAGRCPHTPQPWPYWDSGFFLFFFCEFTVCDSVPPPFLFSSFLHQWLARAVCPRPHTRQCGMIGDAAAGAVQPAGPGGPICAVAADEGLQSMIRLQTVCYGSSRSVANCYCYQYERTSAWQRLVLHRWSKWT